MVFFITQTLYTLKTVIFFSHFGKGKKKFKQTIMLKAFNQANRIYIKF